MASLSPATATRVLSARLPISAPPTGLDECLFFISLVSDFLAIRFSVSSGCARRLGVSTYTAILVLLLMNFYIVFFKKYYDLSCHEHSYTCLWGGRGIGRSQCVLIFNIRR